MIRLTRLNQVSLVLNSDLIEHVEMTPDTVIALTNGQKFVVRETPEEVIQRVIEFRRSILRGSPSHSGALKPESGGTKESMLHVVKNGD
jgi:flagellar protein FlbD